MGRRGICAAPCPPRHIHRRRATPRRRHTADWGTPRPPARRGRRGSASDVRVRQLPPLDDGHIAALIRGVGVEPEAELIALVRTRTGGNPLLVGELLRNVRVTDPPTLRRATLADSVPARVSDLILHRLGWLPAPVADLLITASVVSAEGDTATLAAVHGSGLGPVVDLLDQARAIPPGWSAMRAGSGCSREARRRRFGSSRCRGGGVKLRRSSFGRIVHASPAAADPQTWPA